MGLDHKLRIPLHVQLKKELEKLIFDGYYKDKIPSEREFMEKYSISRSTVREAVSQLVQEGILLKKHGKGTFVSLKPIQEWLGHLTNTTETIRNMGMKPGAKLISHGKVYSGEDIVGVTGFEEVYVIKRIRYADNQPIVMEYDYFPLEIGKQLAQYDLDKVTLYELMEDELVVKFAEAEQIVTCGCPTVEDAKYLGISSSSHCLISERKTYDINGELAVYFKGYFRSDMYSLKINMSRKSF